MGARNCVLTVSQWPGLHSICLLCGSQGCDQEDVSLVEFLVLLRLHVAEAFMIFPCLAIYLQ